MILFQGTRKMLGISLHPNLSRIAPAIPAHRRNALRYWRVFSVLALHSWDQKHLGTAEDWFWISGRLQLNFFSKASSG